MSETEREKRRWQWGGEKPRAASGFGDGFGQGGGEPAQLRPRGAAPLSAANRARRRATRQLTGGTHEDFIFLKILKIPLLFILISFII